jgi:hypothetical protein
VPPACIVLWELGSSGANQNKTNARQGKGIGERRREAAAPHEKRCDLPSAARD